MSAAPIRAPWIFAFALSALLSTPASSLCQPATPSSELTVPSGTPGTDFNLLDGAGRKDGRWLRVYEDGSIYYSGSFDAGRPIGHFTFFHEGGGVHSEVVHGEADVDGHWTSEVVSYRKDGSLAGRGDYSMWMGGNGKPAQEKHGLWRSYDTSGRVRRLENFAQGELHGAFKTFFADGTALEIGLYKEGKRDGNWTRNAASGRKESEQNWASGVPEGGFILYHASGKVMTQGHFRGGLEAGAWKLFLDDGRVHSTVFYERGRIDREVPENGLFQSTYPSDRPSKSEHYEAGLLHGEFVRWYDNGEWSAGAAEVGGGEFGGAGGDMKRFLEGQKMAEKGQYQRGFKHGNWNHYREDGMIDRIERWDMGTLIEE